MSLENRNSKATQTLDNGAVAGADRVHVPNLFIHSAEALDISSDVVLTTPAFIHVNLGGTVVVDLVGGGTEVTFSVDDGGYLFAHVTKVYSTSTATGLVACRG